MYTITLVDRPDLQDAMLIEAGGDNLVLVNKSKYILNWDANTVVNINLGEVNSRHSVAQAQIKQQLR